jgi:hypothetical protein
MAEVTCDVINEQVESCSSTSSHRHVEMISVPGPCRRIQDANVGTKSCPSLQLPRAPSPQEPGQQNSGQSFLPMTNARASQTELKNTRADLRNLGGSGEASTAFGVQVDRDAR